MCSSHNFAGHCGGNSFFGLSYENWQFTVKTKFEKIGVTSTVSTKVMRRTHVNLSLSRFTSVNCKV